MQTKPERGNNGIVSGPVNGRQVIGFYQCFRFIGSPVGTGEQLRPFILEGPLCVFAATPVLGVRCSIPPSLPLSCVVVEAMDISALR